MLLYRYPLNNLYQIFIYISKYKYIRNIQYGNDLRRSNFNCPNVSKPEAVVQLQPPLYGVVQGMKGEIGSDDVFRRKKSLTLQWMGQLENAENVILPEIVYNKDTYLTVTLFVFFIGGQQYGILFIYGPKFIIGKTPDINHQPIAWFLNVLKVNVQGHPSQSTIVAVDIFVIYLLLFKL